MQPNLPTIIVPARLASTRFPNKLLTELDGIPLILHTAKRLAEVAKKFEIIFAVDGEKLEEILSKEGFECIRTDPNLPSGTDRIAQANLKLGRDRVINVQADEPMVRNEHIMSLVRGLDKPDAVISTLATHFHQSHDFHDPNQVKVVLDNEGFAMYFSRSSIPYHMDSEKFEDFSLNNSLPLKHLGLYAYHKNFLLEFSNLNPGKMEKLEKLEQLRALEFGYKIAVTIVEHGTVGVDVPSDLDKIRL